MATGFRLPIRRQPTSQDPGGAATGEADPRYVFQEDKTTSEVVLTRALSRLLMEVLRHVGRGDAVTLVPVMPPNADDATSRYGHLECVAPLTLSAS